jgi:hypothetical protein
MSHSYGLCVNWTQRIAGWINKPNVAVAFDPVTKDQAIFIPLELNQ